ncbi:6-phosphogluconate dehydrogenase-like protein NAD-binding protein [Cucurbitaria berberidis CBS 394.84]|uniref:6-phosphogluconate dehydrogenase-like protein NAD-binding protein n=1 Tax=Cucurbitaria berberidis CBS 394.84 TaxID=1168544 RepID=A0A9P4L3V8_9PLEO|nr:6-phosphogluconate dehydrogenase-like protein NAD-binding protein [Cucurbitaria berberidis CBS 394.84]KAF1840800.1 6-phosphogluconate dehydrogenase-like protein NAD-binding protein [Cucurbitaria berberidis CBS 394.84]
MSSPEQLRLGWIGLGSMGLAMAINIQKYLEEKTLPPLKYWNRTLSRGDVLREKGAVPGQSIAELVQSCDVIFISVSDDQVLKGVTNEVIESGPIDEKIFVDTTTVHPSTTTSITTLLQNKQASYIAAPVFGATPLAQSGTLLIAVAGSHQAIQAISPFLKGVLARAVIVVGSEPSQALLLKTTSNFITAGLMYLLSEAHTFASKTGLPADVLESLIEQNFGAYAHGVSKRLTSGAYFPAEGQAPSSGLELGIKDVGHGVSLAREKGMKVEVGELYLGAAEEAKAFGDERGRKCDSSAVFGVVRQRAGLDFESEEVKERDAARRV